VERLLYTETQTLFVKENDTYLAYAPIYIDRQVRTRSGCLPWYDLGNPNNQTAPLPDDAVPSTISFDRVRQGIIVRVNLSANKLLAVPNLRPQLPAISVFKEKVLAGITKKLHLQAIVEAALDRKLFLSCDGSYQPTSNLAAYSWTLRGHTALGEGSGRPEAEFNSPYRAELYGIFASLLILQHVEETCADIQVTVTIISDCQRALRHALNEGPAGVRTAMQDEYDVTLAIHQLKTQLKLRIKPMWVESHCTSDLSEEQMLNMEAHQLAISRL
jgi:hypothetical protein